MIRPYRFRDSLVRLWLCMTAAVPLYGCLPGVDTEAGADVYVYPADEEIVRKVYDSTYRTPSSFYVDERADTDGSYTVYHVKDPSLSYELCTDSQSEAAEWEAADNDVRAVSGELVDQTENDRYFEFERDNYYPDSIGNISDPTTPGFSRVFKCAYVNRDGVDRNIRNGYAGVLNRRPISAQIVRDFSEYLWQFTFFWPARAVVLDTKSQENDSVVKHTLVLALATSQGTDACDRIDVVDWTFSADRESGEVTKDFLVIRSLYADVVNGVPAPCTS